MGMHQKIHVPVSLTKKLNTNSSNQILKILSSQQFCSLSALTFQYGEMSIKKMAIYNNWWLWFDFLNVTWTVINDFLESELEFKIKMKITFKMLIG